MKSVQYMVRLLVFDEVTRGLARAHTFLIPMRRTAVTEAREVVEFCLASSGPLRRNP